jgi:hypothetical protein
MNRALVIVILQTQSGSDLVERWGPDTQKIVELCLRPPACHLEPEFLEVAGAVGVRFLPSGYVTPLHDLTGHRARFLRPLLVGGNARFANIRAQIAGRFPVRLDVPQ